MLAREDWATQDMAAKLLTAVIENRPKKSSAFANGMLTGDSVAPSVAAAYGGPDPAEPVRPFTGTIFVLPDLLICLI